uniref:Reverse transcriptase domain-containing protein n=1 Tax=Cannabis sativa TaxID=3483 RepID=A0A803P4A1_CANSA
MWIKEADCSNIISDCWQNSNGSPIDVLNKNLSSCADNLRSWHRHKFGQLKQKISSTQADVAALSNIPTPTPTHAQQVQKVESILDELLANEEQYWQQRARVDWLQSGDRNTKIFHAKASARHSNNRIRSLSDENVSEKHNMFLLKEFSADDVYEALKSMNGDGSLGIDGMSALFYQHNWHIVGNLVTQAVLHVLNDGGSPEALNKSLITLIPKIKKPKTMKDVRSISLCNVVYKLISKSLVIRLKSILPHVISETQSAFLPNWLITDNILVAFELVHCLKHKTRGKKGFSALKLDMSKVFDRVEWSFIAVVMGKMGLNICWINLIMNFLQTTQLSFIINGSVSGNVKPQRGLRQGDPLSPHLFLIYSEGLSRLLQYEESIGCLKGLAVSRHSPSVFNLLFADDSLLFCEATDRSCGAIKRALDTYHKALGQQLNTEKSVMSFSPNTTDEAKLSFQNILGMSICDCHESYLNLPSYSERDKKQLFNNIKERIWKLLHTWTDKIFSAGDDTNVYVSNPNLFGALSCPLSFQTLQQQHLPAGLTPAATPSSWNRWQPPSPNCLKLNMDAAFNATSNKIGFGAIIRDSNGIVRAAMSHPIHGCCRPQEMEAKGLFYSLKWARQCNFRVDLVETDSLILADSLKKSTLNRSSFQDLLFDVKTQLSYLPSVCVNHVRRDANQAAHDLAKQVLVLDNVCTLLIPFLAYLIDKNILLFIVYFRLVCFKMVSYFVQA